jgi:hypothetical protein
MNKLMSQLEITIIFYGTKPYDRSDVKLREDDDTKDFAIVTISRCNGFVPLDAT